MEAAEAGDRGQVPGARAIDALDSLRAEIVGCHRCPRLVAWREQVAREKRAAFAGEVYWGRPLPGFGDPSAAVLVLGLAPAAHGANRTGRMFTGDRSGDWLFAALHRAGFANQASSVSADDGLRLSDCWVSAVVRCAPPANKPTPVERDNCLAFLRAELALLARVQVIVTLGAFAWDGAMRTLDAPRPRRSFGHGVEVALGPGCALQRPVTVLGSYHPSQQNTFTGKLTVPMLDKVFTRARELSRSIPGRA